MSDHPSKAELGSSDPAAHTVSSLAKLLRVSPKRVRNWIRQGELRAVNMADPNRRPSWRILPADLERFLEERARVEKSESQAKRRQRAPDVTPYF